MEPAPPSLLNRGVVGELESEQWGTYATGSSALKSIIWSTMRQEFWIHLHTSWKQFKLWSVCWILSTGLSSGLLPIYVGAKNEFFERKKGARQKRSKSQMDKNYSCATHTWAVQCKEEGKRVGSNVGIIDTANSSLEFSTSSYVEGFPLFATRMKFQYNWFLAGQFQFGRF